MENKSRKQINGLHFNINEFTHSESGRCPICGSHLIPTSQQITARFPSPPLEKFTCANANCNYSKYLKVDDIEPSALTKTVK